MTDKQHAYDPDLPYVLVNRQNGEMMGRATHKSIAENFAAGLTVDIIDTTPKSRVPEDARFITWRDLGNDRWYAEREGDAWCTDDGELFGVVEDLPDVTPETVFTVLEERKS